MPDFVEGIMAELQSRVSEELASVTEELGDDLRESISVPVGRSGGRVIRSKPGEPPRRDTGDYLDTIATEDTEGTNRVSGTVYTDSLIGKFLEGGTVKMGARPHFSIVFERWRRRVIDRIAAVTGSRPRA